ncbi:MAG: BTAD domain-containing putative transcriptional regulator [Capsulimonas sp.]|uniref:AfsR/SARP family transcriptional regulator n=1 Tax=Capsulimonas sp. TaxID=2494211 RepID=UPI003263E3B9
MTGLWTVTLFGGLRATRGTEVVDRFRSHNIAALMAYLCLFPRLHSREELADLLWPDAELEAARTNLRTAIASLRRQLELPGDIAGSILITQGRASIGVNPNAVASDVGRFESLLRSAARPEKSVDQKTELLCEAVGIYGQPLLSGFYETWALTERDRLAEAYWSALRELAGLYELSGHRDKALDCARRGVSADPLREEAHAEVIRLLVASGQAAVARRQFSDLEQLLEAEMGLEPSPETRALLDAAPEAPAFVFAKPPAPVDSPKPEPDTPATEPVLVRKPSRLPLTMTQFFGRAKEREALAGLLRSGTRLVTLSGPGGSGKTRLAIEVARDLHEIFTGGSWFVPLADVRDAHRILDAVAEALPVVRSRAVLPFDQIVETLARLGPSVLVLDNFEQLAETGANVVQQLLGAIPDLCCLITSRQRLLLDGEREFPLAPLPTPRTPGAPERLLEFPSIQLFVNRAQAARPDFQLSARNAAAVALLCDKLEGIPLAVELAAAWAQTLSPAQTLERLDRRFDLLVSRRRDIPGRHQTLRATVESSYQLLPTATQRFFAQLGPFRGGWTLDAAEAVSGDRDAIYHLTTLREHSLVLASEDAPMDDSDDPMMRYQMLETLREFADELTADADQRQVLCERHYQHYLTLAQAAEPGLHGPKQASWIKRLHAERHNTRTALTWAAQYDAEAGLHLASVLTRYWEARAFLREGGLFMEQLLAASAGETPLRADILFKSGRFAWYLRNWDLARVRFAESIAMYRSLNDPAGMALPLAASAGLLLMNDGDGMGAYQALEEAWRCTEVTGDLRPRLEIYEWRTVMACGMEDYPTGEHHAREWLALARTLGDRTIEVAALFWLGLLATNLGEPDRARPLYEQAIAVSKTVGETFWGSGAWFGLGLAELLAGDSVRGRDCVQQSYDLLGDRGYQFVHHYLLQALAYIASAQDDAPRAARLLGAVEHLRRTDQTLRASIIGCIFDPYVERAQTALGEEKFAKEQGVGAGMTLDEALAYGLAK